jgi:hypothetical protein
MSLRRIVLLKYINLQNLCTGFSTVGITNFCTWRIDIGNRLWFIGAPVEERKKLLKENNICYKCCASNSHKSRDCSVTISCKECGSKQLTTALHVTKASPQPWRGQRSITLVIDNGIHFMSLRRIVLLKYINLQNLCTGFSTVGIRNFCTWRIDIGNRLWLKENNICYNCCASNSHKSRDCSVTISCKECGSKQHTTALHVTKAIWNVVTFYQHW